MIANPAYGHGLAGDAAMQAVAARSEWSLAEPWLDHELLAFIS